MLPIKRAEELLMTLPGVVAARIVAGETGVVNEIHLLTSAEVNPKATVRNVESALIAHLGMRVDHRKISVATTVDPQKGQEAREAAAEARSVLGRRRVYFEDVEVRRSRARGVTCRVTLRTGKSSHVGESEGAESERSRVELAARAALAALAQAEGEGDAVGEGERDVATTLPLSLDGCRVVEAFEREFVFLGVTARLARDAVLLTGSCEIKDSPETAAVLAVLDATNRWIARSR